MLTICIILIVLLALDLLFTLALRCRKGHRKWEVLKKYRYAHRGYHDKPVVPENSLPAFRRAIERGFGAELDVHLLKDGTLAVFHDSDLKRCANVEGEIEDLTLDELKQLRLEGTDEQIPTFDEVLALFEHETPLIIELKTARGNHMALAKAVCERLDTYKELFYLHPSVFTPDKQVLRDCGFNPDEKYILVRFVAWNASHDIGKHGLDDEGKIRLVKRLERYGRVYVSAEGDVPEELRPRLLKTPYELIHHVLAFAQLVFSEGATMASEAAEQLRQLSVNRPTHVFVQAGVGSLAGAVVGYFANLFPNDPPKFVVMEAGAADCLYQGALAGDGAPRIVGGDLQTIMAGLACGEPNIISWDILRNHVSAFVSCPDWVSAKGMRMLGVPVKGDPTVISGESGAVGMGCLDAIMCDDTYKELREKLELDRFSQVLMFSTEGDTDPEKYRRILWDGEYPTV